jgi:hypothetical protein
LARSEGNDEDHKLAGYDESEFPMAQLWARFQEAIKEVKPEWLAEVSEAASWRWCSWTRRSRS